VPASLQRFEIRSRQPFATIRRSVGWNFFDLGRFSGAQSSARSANAAYTGGLDLEDTLTARCAFAIEKFSERRDGASS
jgi:hypothetical protein